ncbi:MAG: YceD family protein [Verrucomicrobiaceae bacterium]
MKIELVNLPDEGVSLNGELPPETFDLKEEHTKAASPLYYDLHVQRFDSELLLTGALKATFELTCMRSLHPFLQTIEIPEVAISIEIGESGIIDPTDELREELIILLPGNPRCDEGDEGGNCEIDPKYLAVDNPVEDGVDNAPARDEPNPWDALDSLESTD